MLHLRLSNSIPWLGPILSMYYCFYPVRSSTIAWVHFRQSIDIHHIQQNETAAFLYIICFRSLRISYNTNLYNFCLRVCHCFKTKLLNLIWGIENTLISRGNVLRLYYIISVLQCNVFLIPVTLQGIDTIYIWFD